jgi:hypothetical protein
MNRINKHSSRINMHFKKSLVPSSSTKLQMNEREINEWTANFFKGIKNLISGKGWNGKGFISKEQLTKLGLNMLLSYGFVSNVSYITCMIIAWVTHGKRYGLSPLAPGQWKAFLLIYSGFWAANNIIRPARFSLALVLSPGFDRIINFFQRKFNWSKPRATALTVFLVNVVGTISYLVFGLLFATKIAKVPLLPK